MISGWARAALTHIAATVREQVRDRPNHHTRHTETNDPWQTAWNQLSHSERAWTSDTRGDR